MKAKIVPVCVFLALCGFFCVRYCPAEIPGIINYQGRVVANGTNFDGTGQFKFAFVNADASATYWSNGTLAVSLTVTKGLYSVLLGDTTITHMDNAIASSVFTNTDVRLRVWFNDGVAGLQQLAPDQRLAASPYALQSTSPAGSYWDSVCGYVSSQSNGWDTSYSWVSANSNSFLLVTTNVFIGYGAGGSNTTGQQNTYIGPRAGWANTSGNYNTYLGYRAGESNTSGSVNTFIGQVAGSKNTIGSYQTAVGAGALASYNRSVDTECYNTAIGANAMNVNTNGVSNTAVGSRALGNSGSGTWNTAVGRNAGRYCDGDYNVFLGASAAYNDSLSTVTLTNGYYNIYVGRGANPSAAMVTNECVIGGYSSPILDVYFGSGPAIGAYGGSPQNYTIHGSSYSRTGVAGSSAGGNITIAGGYGQLSGAGGSVYLATAPSGDGITLSNRLSVMPDGGVNFFGATNPSLSAAASGKIYFDANSNKFYASENGAAYAQLVGGSATLQQVTTAGNTTSNAIVVLNTAGYKSVVLPVCSNLAASGATVVGYLAGTSLVSAANATIIGEQAAQKLVSGNHNTFVGQQAGWGLVAGRGNTIIGQSSGFYNSNGWWNTYVGYDSGEQPTTGSSNVFMGVYAGRYGAGYENVVLGVGAGSVQGDVTEHNNFYSSCTYLGAWAGANSKGSSNVFIGYSAGYNESGTNKLYVANTATASPLIYGDFAAGYVTINGTNTAKYFIGDGAGLTNIYSATAVTPVNLFAGSITITNGSGRTSFVARAISNLGTDDKFTVAGIDAGAALTTTAYGDTLYGWHAGNKLTTGGGNTAIGGYALENATTHAQNTAIGWGVLYANNTGKDNTAVGFEALTENQGQDNTAVGKLAGGTEGLSTTFSSAVLVGYEAGKVLNTGANNTFVGYSAGHSANSGNNNTFLGCSAGSALTTGAGNIILGSGSSASSVSAGNEFVAGSSSYPVTNVYFGQGASSASPAAYTIRGTAGSGASVAGGDLMISGGKAGDTATSGGSVIIQTAVAGAGTTPSNRIVVTSAGNVGIGTNSPNNKFHVAGLFDCPAERTVIGNNANMAYGSPLGSYNVIIGNQAGYSNNANVNVFIGDWAGWGNVDGYNSVAVGGGAYKYARSGQGNVAVGANAMGWLALGNDNISLGSGSMRQTTNGTGNVAVGGSDLYYNFGSYNTAVGHNSLGQWSVATWFSDNTALGTSSGFNAKGDRNTFIGREAGYGNLSYTNYNNAFLGYQAGYTAYHGSYNTFLGQQAGYNFQHGASNVFIGSRAGYNATSVTGKLYIANSDTASPLIYGDFGSGYVTINGTNTATYFVGNGAGLTNTVVTKAADYTVTAADVVIRVSAAATITLPAATGTGKVYYIKRVGSGAVSVSRSGSDLIDGATSVSLAAQYDVVRLVDGASGVWDKL